MRIGLFGALNVEHDGQRIVVSGAMQLAVLFRLVVDAGRAVSYREIVEDVWSTDAPENERAALQSVISRLRSQLPTGSIESTAGGYRLAIAREDVDALVFADLVAVGTPDAASRALTLWTGEPWIPSENFDWFERDLRRDHSVAKRLGGSETRSSIPAPFTALVGRDVELAMIAAQLEANRLVTIVGTGGAGKTRLAIETALRHKGSLLVELAPVGRGEVMAAVLTSTGRELRVDASAEIVGTRDRVVEALFGREIVLLLDNCEHVIDEAAGVASDLLAALPNLRVLATSREPLAIPGEAFVAVGSLPHPRDGETGDLLDFAAVELFRQRASAARGVDLNSEEVPIAARITTRLDGLPLAIELAAAKLRTMSIDEVLVGLEDRFALLTGGYRTALPRHQTLRAMIDWSWSLLTLDEQATLAQLAVFPSGVAVDDTGALAEAMGIRASFDSLVDRSLLQRSRGRYRTLETIREYGLEKLAESGKTTDARELQARHQTACAQRFDRLLRGYRINESIAWFDAEEDNISAALRFVVAHPLPEVAVSLLMSCAWYWIIRDRQDDAEVWFPQVLPLAAGVEGEEALFLHVLEPVMAAFAGEGDGLSEEQDPSRMIGMLAPLADLRPGPGSHEVLQILPSAIAAFGAVATEPDWMIKVQLPRGEDLGLDPWPTALLHVIGAAMAHNRGDIDALGTESDLGVAMFEKIGDLWGLAVAQQMKAEWLLLQGRLEESLTLSDNSTENMRRITTAWDLAQQQGLAISILVRLGRVDEARERSEQMIADSALDGNGRAQLQTNVNALSVDLGLGDLEAAKMHAARIDELVEGMPFPWRQLGAWIYMGKAGISILEGDTDAAELHLRKAAESAFASFDLPVISELAITLGTLCVARGDLKLALQAVDLAAAVAGIYDATHPHILRIEAAAAAANVKRASAAALTRPLALETLKDLLET